MWSRSAGHTTSHSRTQSLGPETQAEYFAASRIILSSFSRKENNLNVFAKYSAFLALVTGPVHHAAEVRLQPLLTHVSIIIIVSILLILLLMRVIMTNTPGFGRRHFERQPHKKRGEFGLNVAPGAGKKFANIFVFWFVCLPQS